MRQPSDELANIIDLALEEDGGSGDITSDILLPENQQGKAAIIANAEGVLAGGDTARLAFLKVDPSLVATFSIPDGSMVKPKDIVATIEGNVAGILKAERVALNFLCHLSGIASETARYVAGVRGTATVITDTRKTSPGLRLLEKQAVRSGGGHNHRLNLASGILIKDNHIAALRHLGMSLKDIVAKARQNAPRGSTIEIEVNTTAEAIEAANAGADIIMLDNMTPDDVRRVAGLVSTRTKLEASGGINLDNIKAYAATGVDYISIGAITHSARALDFSLKLS
ncbi:MAG: carboxylating nicotinate-nucleotide diphosphorylase [Dehalococcoidales bacterium]|nr:carboxylating nicotinate-nucleotide diphosphorylase [Dehalococcoidales bacterium]